MGDVTGPISSFPGTSHQVPNGMTCESHPDRPAVARIQGETDSMGCEMIDLCQACIDKDRAYRLSDAGKAEAAAERCGCCDWCSREATDLRDARDYEEGMCGRIYRVCGACVKRANDEAKAELDRYGGYGDYDE